MRYVKMLLVVLALVLVSSLVLLFNPSGTSGVDSIVDELQDDRGRLEATGEAIGRAVDGLQTTGRELGTSLERSREAGEGVLERLADSSDRARQLAGAVEGLADTQAGFDGAVAELGRNNHLFEQYIANH
jgi:hypothetical protein